MLKKVKCAPKFPQNGEFSGPYLGYFRGSFPTGQNCRGRGKSRIRVQTDRQTDRHVVDLTV